MKGKVSYLTENENKGYSLRLVRTDNESKQRKSIIRTGTGKR
jgi:hypothetical protein